MTIRPVRKKRKGMLSGEAPERPSHVQLCWSSVMPVPGKKKPGRVGPARCRAASGKRTRTTETLFVTEAASKKWIRQKSSTFAANAGRASVGNHPSTGISKSTAERDLTNAPSVAKASLRGPDSPSTQGECITRSLLQKGSPANARTVGRL